MKRLEKDEALRAPLYAVAALLVLLPAVDFLQSVGAPQPANLQWRFATVGVLSSYLGTPLLGAAIALVVAAQSSHHGVRRVLVTLCFIASAALVLSLAGFALDVLQLRNAVRPEALASFKGASLGAALKITLVAAGMAFLGWRALRIEAPQRNRSDRRASVPLVTGPEATAGVVGRQEPGRG